MTSTSTAANNRTFLIFFGLAALLYLVAAFSAVRDNGFQNGTEDIHMIEKGERLYSNPSSILEPDEAGRNNIFSYLLLGGIHKIFGLQPVYYYAILLTFHFCVYLLMMELGRRLFKDLRPAALAATFFLVLSIHFQTIGWMENLGRVSMVILSLGSLLSFDDYRKTNRKGKLFLSWFLWLLALNCAEEAIVFPFILIAYNFLVLKSKSRMSLWIPFLGVQAAYFLFQSFFYGGAMQSYMASDFDAVNKIKGMFWSLANLFVPRAEFFPSYIEPSHALRLAIPAVVFLPVLWIFFRQGKSWFQKDFPFILFCLIWFAIAFSPYSLRAMGTSWTEYPQPRYLYFPMVGIGLLAGYLGSRIWSTPFLTAGIYFYVLNVSTYYFMVEKLCRTACN